MKTLALAALLVGWVAIAQARVIYVDTDAPGLNSGSSWYHAFWYLDDALEVAEPDDEVWVAEGTYCPARGTDWTKTFLVPNAVQVYGGFSGVESAREERSWDAHPTILTGDLGLTPGYQTVSQYVVTMTTTDSTTCLDGFTVSDGEHGVLISGGNPKIANSIIENNRTWGGGHGAGIYAPSGTDASIIGTDLSNNVATGGSGGGLYTFGGRLKIEDTRFIGNSATISAGGMLGTADFVDVLFQDNDADDGGGGLVGGGTLTRVEFYQNESAYGTGGMLGYAEFRDCSFVRNRGSTAGLAYQLGGALSGGGTLVNVLFERNTHTVAGGAMQDGGGGSTLINVVFRGNSVSGSHGGGALWVGADPYAPATTPGLVTMINCTFQGNVCSAAGGGGGVAYGSVYTRGGNLIVKNSILWGNAVGREIVREDAVALIDHCLIEGSGASGALWDWFLGTDFGDNLDTDPLFADVTASNLRLTSSSPAINAGDRWALPPEITTDLDGNPRVMFTEVDMGAYEATRAVAAPGAERIRSAIRVAPNPFNPATTIQYAVGHGGPVRLAIYDLRGRRVRTLVDMIREVGHYDVPWNGRDESGTLVASGVYVCRLDAPDGQVTRTIALVK